jgi:hypothetical protein
MPTNREQDDDDDDDDDDDHANTSEVRASVAYPPTHSLTHSFTN